MAILTRTELLPLYTNQPNPIIICCSDFNVLKSIKIIPAKNEHSLWHILGACQPNHIVIYFGYKGVVYRIVITANGICYSIHEDTYYDWRIDVWEMNNQEVNRFGRFFESPEVPINYAYHLLLEKVIETEDFYE